MFNNTSGASAGTLAPQPNAAASNFAAPNFAAPAAAAPQLPVPAGARPVYGVPGVQRAINLPSRPIAIWAVSLFLMLYMSTYPLQPLVGLEFTGAYMFAGMTMGLTMVLPIVLGVVSAWYLNEGYEWARVVIIIEGALRMILDIVYVVLCAHVFFDNEYDSQMLRVLFFGPFMTLEVLCAKLAFDFISRIVIIVLLCQPQVGRYIHMRGDLRRMGVR
ncbi:MULTISPECIES: hypothetical protein [Rothia]|jgi:hypothetical protein|uniref:hypothetical protein n=1 Tax=Rothia TaxID=32207 RepID=UPI0008A472C9|nr:MULTISPECIES: hypothetical protein [Rothia]OFL24140.1 hypothetical protein HMPREF2779_00885 [Rothia sp. HMSC069C03]OFQ61567.1 hypothetical protein HMPREF2927_04585 [Rothia sp. HMSC061E04]